MNQIKTIFDGLFEESVDLINSEKPTQKLNVGSGLLSKPKDFSKRSKDTLMQSAIALESLGIENVVIITLTLPGSTPGALDAIERYSRFTVNRFNQYIRRWLEEASYFWCYEYQSRGALHLNYAVHVPPELRFRFTEDRIRGEWHTILESLSIKAGVDVFEIDGGYTWRYRPEVLRVKAQQCRRSVVTYFAKHDQKKPRLDEEGMLRSPSCWCNVSKSLRQRIEELSLTRVFLCCCDKHALEVIENTASHLEGTRKIILHPMSRRPYGISIFTDRINLINTRNYLLETAKILNSQFGGQRSPSSQCLSCKPQMVVFELLVNGYCRLKLTEARAYAEHLKD